MKEQDGLDDAFTVSSDENTEGSIGVFGFVLVDLPTGLALSLACLL